MILVYNVHISNYSTYHGGISKLLDTKSLLFGTKSLLFGMYTLM